MRPVTPDEIAADLGIVDGVFDPEKVLDASHRKISERPVPKSPAPPRTLSRLRDRSDPSQAQRLLYLNFQSGKYSDEELATIHGYNSLKDMRKDIRLVHAWSYGNFARDIDKAKMEQDAQLRRIYAMAMDGYRSSVRPKITRKRKKGFDDKGETSMSERTVEEQNYDPRYLNVSLGALQQIAELHGLNAKKQVEHTGADGGPIKLEMLHKKFGEMSDDELKLYRQANRALLSVNEPAIDAEYEVKHGDAPADS